MECKNLIRKVQSFGWPEDQYVVIGSGPLGMRGIRETNDLDTMVTDDLWSKLVEEFGSEQEYGVTKIKIDRKIEIVRDGSFYRDLAIASVEEMIQTADIIEGVRFLNLPLLKKFKQKFDREKDKKDIALIDHYLASQKNSG